MGEKVKREEREEKLGEMEKIRKEIEREKRWWGSCIFFYGFYNFCIT